jgi:hypothetical protein
MSSRKLNGTNDLDALSLYLERIFYKAYAYDTDTVEDPSKILQDLPAGVKNFWFVENILYGKVNPHLTPVKVISTSLSKISEELVQTGMGDLYAVDFVTEAFTKFCNFFDGAVRTRKLAKSSYLYVPKAYAAYKNADLLYLQFIKDFVGKYNGHILQMGRYAKIKNFGDYVKMFFNFCLKDMSDTIITKSSYYLGSNLSALVGGLSIEISDLDPSSDREKQEKFINDPNFSFYRQAAINAGFIIDKNIPWRLNIDLSSSVTKMQLGTKIPAYTGAPREVFTYYYSFVSSDDVPTLQAALYDGYVDFVKANRYYQNEKGCLMERPDPASLSFQTSIVDVPLFYWYKKYIQLKNMEKGHPYTEYEAKRIFINTAYIMGSKGQGKGISYANEKFNLPFLYEGSLTYSRLKKYFKGIDNFSLDNFSEYVKMIVKRSSETIY